MEYEPSERNSPFNIKARAEYSVMASKWLNDQIVFIDEKGFDLHSIRNRGRSVIGKKALIYAPTCQGAHISVCAALSSKYGIMAYHIIYGTFRKEEYLEFLSKLFLHPAFAHSTMRLIMDNGPAHIPYAIKEYIENQNILHHCIYLPPYSPHLNAM